MRIKINILLYSLFIILIAFSCNKDNTTSTGIPVEDTQRITLFYMAADNNLERFLDNNIVEIGSKMKETNKYRVFVYFDKQNGAPELFELKREGSITVRKIIKTYPIQNSASVEVMRSVIDYVHTTFKADKYGLVLSSHGTGWMPTDINTFSMRSYSYDDGFPLTKTFGTDNHPYGTDDMTMQDMCAAIPSGIFDYLIFDACYMGGIEVAYELKDKADIIVFSSAEVLSKGFPYDVLSDELLSISPDFKNVCQNIFNVYNSDSNSMLRSLTISYVNTAHLDGLANIVESIVEKAKNKNSSVIDNFNINKIQYFDTFNRHFAFDLENFIENVADVEDLNVFKEQMNKVVGYKVSTEYFFNTIKIDRFCGVSTYIPITRYGELTKKYYDMAWAKKVYAME